VTDNFDRTLGGLFLLAPTIWLVALAATVVLSFPAQVSAQTNTFPWPSSGNVGIGTTNPVTVLDVFAAPGNGISLVESDAPWNFLQLLLNSNGSNTLNGAYSLVIEPDGNNSWGYTDTGVGIDIKATSASIPTKNAFRIRTDYTGTPNTLFTVLGNGSVGIGTTTPSAFLTVQPSNTGSTSLLSLNNTGNNSGGASSTAFIHSDQPYEAGNNAIAYTGAVLQVTAFPNTATNNTGDTLRVGTSDSAGNFFAPQLIVKASTGNVGIGTTNPQHLLHVAGTIGAEEVIVSSTGADYVFQSGYRLRPLSEVNAFIQENHHLPDIPSALEMEEKGLNLGDMQAKLLAKVEELTLNAIEASNQIQKTRDENQALEQQNRRLEERLASLEARIKGVVGQCEMAHGASK
jgi:hypothetical protein